MSAFFNSEKNKRHPEKLRAFFSREILKYSLAHLRYTILQKIERMSYNYMHRSRVITRLKCKLMVMCII